MIAVGASMSGLRRGQIDPGCDAVGDGSRTDTASGLPLTRCDIRAGGMASAFPVDKPRRSPPETPATPARRQIWTEESNTLLGSLSGCPVK